MAGLEPNRDAYTRLVLKAFQLQSENNRLLHKQVERLKKDKLILEAQLKVLNIPKLTYNKEK